MGDLDDLTGAPAAPHWADPDAPRESQVAGAAVDAIRALLLENARRGHEEARLHGEIEHLRHELARAHGRSVQRAKERTLRVARRSVVGRALHRAYRAARGGSARSA